jgi:hypothetical protein
MDDSRPTADASTAASGNGSAARRFARAISSPWVAMALLVVVFIHQAVGSAFYPIRQAYELNEMEWFNGTASAILWLAICLCLITASVVRVPWTLRKIGTHITHLGVVLVVITCWIYFGFKHEGDALLVRRYVKVESTDGGACRLLPNPGFTGVLGVGTATVQSIMPRWTILSPQGKSEQAWAVMVEIELPNAPKFTATLIEDRPDLTQYTLTGPRTESFLADYPRVALTDGKLHATTTDGKDVLATELKKGAKSVEAITGGERSLEITNLSDTQVDWTLKTPAGQQSGSSLINQPGITRFTRARLKSAPDARLKSIALEIAPERIAYHKDRAALWVRRANDAREGDPLRPMRPMDEKSVTALPIRGLPRYHEHGADLPGAKPLELPIGSVNDVSFKVTAFAPYARLSTRWKDVAEAPLDPRLEIRITSGSDGRSFPRLVPPSTAESVADQPLTWVHCADQAAYDALRLRLQGMTAQAGAEPTQEEAGRTRLVLVTSPVLSGPGKHSVTLLVAQPGGPVRDYPLSAGEQAAFSLLGETVTVRLEQILQHPRQVTEPVVVPLDSRQSRMSVGDYESLIQVTATGTQGVSTMWVPYTPYPHLPRTLGNEGSLGMYAPRPVTIDVPGAGRFELCYGKEPLPMPGDIWMTGFDVPRRPGSNSPSEFFCHVGYGDGGQSSTPGDARTAVIHMNHPLEWDGTFFFQASWDPQSQALTVLGVGNRPAGDAMLWASIVLALGMAISGAMAALPRSKP